jgi:putative oxidoreductase
MILSKKLKQIVTSKILAFLFRLCVGGFFLYASVSKIAYPAQFAEATANYQLVPYWMLNIGSVILPWIEFVCGLFLIIGFMSRASTVLIGLLLIMFDVMVLINMQWGAPISCGCYDTVGEPIGWKKVTENAVMLMCMVHVYFYDRLFIFHRGRKTDPARIAAPSPAGSK